MERRGWFRKQIGDKIFANEECVCAGKITTDKRISKVSADSLQREQARPKDERTVPRCIRLVGDFPIVLRGNRSIVFAAHTRGRERWSARHIHEVLRSMSIDRRSNSTGTVCRSKIFWALSRVKNSSETINRLFKIISPHLSRIESMFFLSPSNQYPDHPFSNRYAELFPSHRQRQTQQKILLVGPMREKISARIPSSPF